MFAYSIINFHEQTPGNLCNVIANKFHFPVHHLAEQVMTYFNQERQEDRNLPATADLQPLLFGKMHLYPAAIPGHTIVITQYDINNVIID